MNRSVHIKFKKYLTQNKQIKKKKFHHKKKNCIKTETTGSKNYFIFFSFYFSTLRPIYIVIERCIVLLCILRSIV